MSLTVHSALGNYSSNILHKQSFFYFSFTNDLLGQPCSGVPGFSTEGQQQVCPLRLSESGLGAGLPLIGDALSVTTEP